MKQKNKRIVKLICVCSIMALCCIIFSACTSGGIKKSDNSIAMIKNATMSTYGTGFAVGVPGKKVDTIVTSYSIVATPNGAVPKTAEVSINEVEDMIIANVVFYDQARNIAVLKLPEGTKALKPLVLEDKAIENKDTVYVRGYDGTGNIMSDYQNFNTTDIIQYSGNVSTYDEVNSMLVYRFSNEFNRALVGAPAVNEKGNVVGMCAYSLSNMNTFSQYILSTEELVKCLINQKLEFMTSNEELYKSIIIISIIAGCLLLVAIIIVTVMVVNKKNKKNAVMHEIVGNNRQDEQNTYIKAVGGTLTGKVFEFDEKIFIGKDQTKCDAVYPIQEPGIDNVHCSIQKYEDVYYLVDNFSKGGTFLEDGTQIVSSLPHKIESKTFAFYIADPKNKFEFVIKEEM